MPSPVWVRSLCPADLLHYHDLAHEALIGDRRFDLAVASAAAKLQFDQGESLNALAKLLGGPDRKAGAEPKGKRTFGAAMAERKGRRGDDAA